MATWCTVELVNTITGVTVSEELLDRAQRVIDGYAGVWPEDDQVNGGTVELTRKDRRRLEDALAYQAAWMKPAVDLMTRTDVSRASQDGESFEYKDKDAINLAPLAQRQLRRLSWKRNQVLRVQRVTRRGTVRGGPDSLADFLTDATDAGNVWHS